jgi:DNA sulfur modification protein DndD
MSVIINQLELRNWFNYTGEYEDNTIKFSDGLNIIIGDNNSGKTKLHNAFRWILKNEVIIIEGNDAIETEIKSTYLKKVINHTAFRNAHNGDNLTFGVKVRFTRIQRDQKQTYLLTKEFICRKEIEELVFLRENKTVQFVDSRTNKPRTISDDFDVVAKYIISNNFLDFFLIEGEQLGNLTPLEGNKLQSTINSIVYLDVLDHLVLKSSFLNKKTDCLYDEILKEEQNLNKDIKDAIESIQNKKQELSDIHDSIKDHEKIIRINEDLISEYKKKAESSQKKKKLYEEYESLKARVGVEEAKKENFIRTFNSNLLNQSTFAISKISDDSDVLKRISDQKTEIQTFIAKRKTEIDVNLDEEEQKIIMSLERSQPKPEILNQMVKNNHCFVCHRDLDEKSKDFLQNKLIPFFQEEPEEDEQLEKLTQLQDLFKNLEVETVKYTSKDDAYFDEIQKNNIDLTTNIINAQNELSEFLEFNGKVVLNEDDPVNIETYGAAKKKIEEAQKSIDGLKKESEDINTSIKKLEAFVKANTGTESERLKRSDALKSFSKDIDFILREYKRQTYFKFTQRLEENATKRFQELMKHNKARSHRIKVDLIEKSDVNFEFKINVVNSFNEIQDQAGGADQAIRRVSVVFALLDLAENKNGYPFIADAPTSRLSPDNKKEFFNSLLNDPALKQSIVLTMDLISAQETKTQNRVIINKIGQELLEEVKEYPDTRIMSIYNDKFGTIKN